MNDLRKWISGLVLIGSLILFFIPPMGEVNREALQAGALVLFTMGFWATGVLPEYLTALIFMLAAMILRIAPAPVVFSGFSSGALWLVFGGLVIANGVKSAGLDRRLSVWLSRVPITSYAMAISGMVLFTMLLGFFIPSTMGRVLLTVPLAAVLSERLGFAADSPGRKGLVLAATLASFTTACAILPANVPNMVLAGASETLYDLRFGYGSYLKLHFPVMGVLKGLALIILICRLYPDRIRSAAPLERQSAQSLRDPEKTLMVVLLATLILWATDSFHGVSPAWVALAAALVCIIPSAGIFPDGVFNHGVNLGPFFHVAGVLGIVTLIGSSRLSEVLGTRLIDLIGFEPGHDLRNFISLSLMSTFLSPLTTPPGVVAIMTPLASKVATVTGFPLISVLMTQVVGFSSPLLPYHVAPIIVGIQLGGVRPRDAARLTLSLVAVSIVILIPVNYLWWRLLGMFGSG